jgi:hypothetical protein
LHYFAVVDLKEACLLRGVRDSAVLDKWLSGNGENAAVSTIAHVRERDDKRRHSPTPTFIHARARTNTANTHRLSGFDEQGGHVEVQHAK